MPYSSRSENLPILDLQLISDQLTLGNELRDTNYLYQVLSNNVNVENFIQLYAQSNAHAINLLFKSLEILNEHEKLRECIPNILCLIYAHCYDKLTQQAEHFIVNYTGMNQEELNSLIQPSYFISYYSEGIKRQRIKPRLNDKENAESEFDSSKKHERDPTELNPAKRQKLNLMSQANKRVAVIPTANASKRIRFIQ